MILVVEDDDTLRPAIARMLLSIGYCVLTAENGLEALAVVDSCPQRIDVILSDVVMPELDGPGFVKRLAARGIRPGVIFMSGYTDPTVLARVPCSPKVPVLVKPFTLQALVHALGETLHGGA
jgi:two-component system, cell cycle sensor histidine kinase and response regulator CckA